MTRFVFKSLIIAGAFLFFGGHLPLPEGLPRGNAAAALHMSLADPALIELLDEQVVPDFAVAAAERQIAIFAHHIIEGVETGRR